MTLLSLREAEGEPGIFAARLARRLRWWFVGIPAGMGLGTAKSILKLWCGFSPARSGVGSAGNGPMMRAPMIGCWFSDDASLRLAFTDVSTRITHSDPRAAEGARIVSEAAALACRRAMNEEVLESLEPFAESREFEIVCRNLKTAIEEGGSLEDFVSQVLRVSGKVSGFAPESAAVALFCWLRHRGNVRACIESAVRAGGDTDTVAFIAGSLAGIDAGRKGIPQDWLDGILDWPLHASGLARAAGGDLRCYPVLPLTWIRNAAFLLIVLFHGFRRLAPPY